MESKKERYRRLEEKLKKSNKDFIQCKIDLEKEKIKGLEAKLQLENSKQRLIKIFGFDIYRMEDDLIKSVNQIINN